MLKLEQFILNEFTSYSTMDRYLIGENLYNDYSASHRKWRTLYDSLLL